MARFLLSSGCLTHIRTGKISLMPTICSRKLRSRGIVAPVLVFGIFILLLIFDYSGSFLGVSLWQEVASAEAGQTVRLALESSLEEAIQGFILSVNMTEKEARSASDATKLQFAKTIRQLEPGEVAHARFVPKNTHHGRRAPRS